MKQRRPGPHDTRLAEYGTVALVGGDPVLALEIAVLAMILVLVAVLDEHIA